MKILKVDKSVYERERLKSSRILLGFFTFLVMLWPIIYAEFFYEGYYMGSAQIKTFESHSKVDETGDAVITETITADFKKKERYVKIVAEASATDSEIRYLSYPIEAKIDGKKVKVRERNFGGSAQYFLIGDKMTGLHTIEFTYGTRNAVIYDKGVAVYRARLMNHAAISGVESFKGTVELPNIITEDTVCWTSEAARVSEEEDRCEFTELTSNKIVIEQDDPKYMRSIRLYAPLEGDSFEEHRVPWSAFWNTTLGKHPLTPLWALLGTIAVCLSGRYVVRKVAPTRHKDKLLPAVAVLSSIYLGVLFFTNFLMPSILLLPWVALLWSGQKFYLSQTSGRNLLTESEIEALQERVEASDTSDAQSETDSSREA